METKQHVENNDAENNPETKEGDVEISIATAEDLIGIQNVFDETWKDTYPNKELGITVTDIEEKFRGHNTEEELERRAERMLHPPPGETTLVAREAGEVIGICRVIVTDEKNILQALYVLPKYQKKGVGKKLWEEAQQHFDPGKNIFVNVVTYNDDAIKFYRKLGFEDTEQRSPFDPKLKSGVKMEQMTMVKKA